MAMLIPRLQLLLLVALVFVCFTLGKKYKDPCGGYYCANGGVCILKNGYGYRCPTPICQCTGNWTGERCDDNPCIDVDCNMGTCYSDGNGSPHCCCPTGTSGDLCENAEDPCDNVNCNGGACNTDTDGTTSCSCPPSTTGQFCENVYNPCDYVDCNNGTCDAHSDGTTSCSCPEGKTGQFCELDVHPCDYVNCNNGTCVLRLNGGTYCACPVGSIGLFCEANTICYPPAECKAGCAHDEVRLYYKICQDSICCIKRIQN